MGLGTKTLLLLLCISFLFTIAPNPASDVGYGYGTVFNLFGSNLTGYSVSQTQSGLNQTGYTPPTIFDLVGDSILISAGGAIVAYALAYSSGYGIFAAISVFLLSLFTIPHALLSNDLIPIEIRVLVGSVFFILILVSALSFFRGYEW